MSELGQGLIRAAREALAYAKGEVDVTQYKVHIPSDIDVKKIRRKTGLTQAQFAARFGFSSGRIRDWEQGRSNLDAPSRLLLALIDQEPEAVNRVIEHQPH